MEVTGSIINVTWSHIPNDPGFDQAAGYRIYYFDQTELKNITIPANRSHITITDVKQNVAYDITVAGLTIENQEGRRVHTSIIIKNITGIVEEIRKPARLFSLAMVICNDHNIVESF